MWPDNDYQIISDGSSIWVQDTINDKVVVEYDTNTVTFQEVYDEIAVWEGLD